MLVLLGRFHAYRMFTAPLRHVATRRRTSLVARSSLLDAVWRRLAWGGDVLYDCRG